MIIVILVLASALVIGLALLAPRGKDLYCRCGHNVMRNVYYNDAAHRFHLRDHLTLTCDNCRRIGGRYEL